MNKFFAIVAIAGTLVGGSTATAAAKPADRTTTHTVSANSNSANSIGKIINNIKNLFKQSPSVGHSGRNR